MEIKCEIERIAADLDGNILLTLKTKRTDALIEFVNDNAGKALKAILKRFSKKRSLDSNNYLWALLDDLAELQSTTKEELYQIMLQRYSKSVIHPAVNEEAIENLKKVYRIVIDRGPATVVTMSGNYVEVHQMQCYKGSSLFDQQEMNRLLNGVVSECRENGISTMTDSEIREMNERWGMDFEKHSHRQ